MGRDFCQEVHLSAKYSSAAGFFFWVLLESVESSFIFDFHATRLCKIAYLFIYLFIFTLLDVKFHVLPFCKFMLFSFVFIRWTFYFHFDAAEVLVLSSKILSLFQTGESDAVL